jgi:hypothetical protein
MARPWPRAEPRTHPYGPTLGTVASSASPIRLEGSRRRGRPRLERCSRQPDEPRQRRHGRLMASTALIRVFSGGIYMPGRVGAATWPSFGRVILCPSHSSAVNPVSTGTTAVTCVSPTGFSASSRARCWPSTCSSGQCSQFRKGEAIILLRSVADESNALLLEHLPRVVVLVGIGPTEAARDRTTNL